jgi:hypothetical protein
MAMIATPAMAASPSSTPAPAGTAHRPAIGAVNTRVENVQGMQAMGGRRNAIIITAAIVAAALAVCFGVPVCKDDDSPPASP